MADEKKIRFILALVILGSIGVVIWFWQLKRDTDSDNPLLLYGNKDPKQFPR